MIVSLGQLGLLFALPLFLQGANGLSAEQNGLWMLPLGLTMIVGAQVGGKLNHRYGTTNVVRFGFFLEAFSLVGLLLTVHPGMGFWQLLPSLSLFGLGVGAASGPLTNLVLSEISMEKAGVASGANSTARQLGAALGAAMMGSLVTVQTTSHAVDAVNAAGLPAGLTDTAVNGIEAMGANWQIPAGATPDQAAIPPTRLRAGPHQRRALGPRLGRAARVRRGPHEPAHPPGPARGRAHPGRRRRQGGGRARRRGPPRRRDRGRGGDPPAHADRRPLSPTPTAAAREPAAVP